MITIIAAVITFLLLDGIWLGLIGTQWYVQGFGKLMQMSESGSIQPYWPAAIIVYIALIAGILFFVVPKAQGNIWHGLLWGMLFGFVTYATYDFTNLSVLKDWQWKISIIDTCWGMVLCGVTSMVTVFVSNLINN